MAARQKDGKLVVLRGGELVVHRGMLGKTGA
jgi:hypothetical protein